MIVIKLPGDAADHPYMLAEVIVSAGSKVSKGDALFKLVRAGTQAKITFRAPLDGTIGAYLVGGTELLGTPGQHIVTMEKDQVPEPEGIPEGAKDSEAAAQAPPLRDYALYLPDDPDLFPVKINAWLVALGETVTQGEPLAKVTLGDGQPWVIKALASGEVNAIAAETGSYVTRMAPLVCKIRGDEAQTTGGPDAAPHPAPKAQPSPPEPKPQDLCSVKGPDVQTHYPMSVIAWHVKPGEFIGKGQVALTLRQATGDMTWMRSSEAGRLLSRNIEAGQFFGYDDAVFVVDRADVPPVGWHMPADPPKPTASHPKPAAGSVEDTEKGTAAGTGAGTTGTGRATPKPEHTATAQPKPAAPHTQGTPQPSTWDALVLFLAPILWVGLGLVYVFNGSRIVFAGGLLLILFVTGRFWKNLLTFAVASIVVVATAIVMTLPQDTVLHPKVTAWEPFGFGVPSPDGEWHGDFFENLNRPTPTKQQQADFNAWLEG